MFPTFSLEDDDVQVLPINKAWDCLRKAMPGVSLESIHAHMALFMIDAISGQAWALEDGSLIRFDVSRNTVDEKFLKAVLGFIMAAGDAWLQLLSRVPEEQHNWPGVHMIATLTGKPLVMPANQSRYVH